MASTGENIRSVRKTLSDLKTMTGQFDMISDITFKLMTILAEVYN